MTVLGLPAAASAAPAFAETDGITVTGTTTATLVGVINPENEPTTYELQWDVASANWCTSGGTSGSAANSTPPVDLDASWSASYVSVDLTGLTYETKYCAEFVATNADGSYIKPQDGYATGQVTWVESTPEVSTTDAYATSPNDAVVEGQINPHGGTTVYMAQYATADSDWCSSGGATGTPSTNLDWSSLGYTDDTFHPVSVKLFQLTPGTTYCVRLMADSAGEGDGNMVTFTANKPGAFTDGGSSTGGSTATVTGSVNPNGATTSYQARYDLASSTWCTSGGKSGSPANSSAPTQLGFTDEGYHDVSVHLTGLTAGSEYCAQLVASNVNGEDDGGQVTWTQGSAPDASTWDTYSSGATSATVEGFVDPKSEATDYYAQYDLAGSTWCTSGGASGSPTYTTSPTSDGLDSTSSGYQYVSVDLTGLTEQADYCAQLVATDANGTADGGQVFWTQGAPFTDTLDANPTGLTTATIDGDVNAGAQAPTYELQYDLASSQWCESNGTSGSPAHTVAGPTTVPIDGQFHQVQFNLTGLAQSTSYCGDVVATNSDGSADGGHLEWTQPAPPQHTLTVTTSGKGNVSSSPSGINCGSAIFATSCSYDFAEGAQVTLTASPGFAFGSTVSWTGAPGCSTGPTCTVTMTGDESVGVAFSLQAPPSSAQLDVGVIGGQNGPLGTITSNPAGIDCGVGASVCYWSFPVGAQVTLTATADASVGATFSGWSGGGCSGTDTCTVTIAATGTPTITAAFSPSEQTANCSLKPATKVALEGSTAGLLPVGLTCDQGVTFSLSGGVTVQWFVWKKHKPHTKRWRKTMRYKASLHAVTGQAHAGVATTITFKLPARLLLALKRHRTAWGSAGFEVDSTNDNGAGVDTARLKRFR